MKISTLTKFVCALMAVLFIISAVVFPMTSVSDWEKGELEAFELIARIIGYLAATALLALCSAGGIMVKSEKLRHWLSLLIDWVILGCVGALIINDIMMYIDYGNVIEGDLTMTQFFALDAGLLIFTLTPLICKLKRIGGKGRRTLYIAAVAVWAVYIVGDTLGYPTALITDWDEQLMKFGFLAATLANMLIFDSYSDRKRIKQ